MYKKIPLDSDMLSSDAMIFLAVLILSRKPFAIYLMKIEMHVNKYVSQQESRHPTCRHTYSRISGRGKGCIGIESWAHRLVSLIQTTLGLHQLKVLSIFW